MATLTDEQVNYIANDIRAHGIRLEGLQDNLLDHICILVEQGMGEGGEFAQLYAALIPTFYKKELYELEEEALFLASLKGPRLLLGRGRFFAVLIGLFLSPYLFYVVLDLLHALPVAYYAPPRVLLRWTCVGCVWPLLSLLVICFTPDRFDPLVPRHAKVLLGGGALIRVCPG
ncbi:hypothetical protein [Puia dinghuensis]|uniref:Uncharacterized protein n=1 Tax=Puia dinghuensis TaxID=1792502 RepID=A0A8J2U7W7_9BACT|nr:hypothetical protein [Puia dinghuensis]GGA84251.1 hypothetical protein GCM10011511_04250 [Puia dinghuensis]